MQVRKSKRGKAQLFGSRFAIPVLAIAVLAFAVTPAAFALKSSMNSQTDEQLTSVRGIVTAFLYDDEWENETDEHDVNETDDHDVNDTEDQDDLDDENEIDDDQDDMDARIESANNKTHEPKVSAFVIDNKTIVELGPWWYWLSLNMSVTDFVHVGDEVNVTGELEEDEDGMSVLSAWHIDNITTGKELTIKEEGRPPWAGGPKGLGIDPWPSSHEDD